MLNQLTVSDVYLGQRTDYAGERTWCRTTALSLIHGPMPDQCAWDSGSSDGGYTRCEYTNPASFSRYFNRKLSDWVSVY